MYFSQQMIEHTIAIRRQVPAEFKPRVKLTSETLFEDLLEYYYEDCPTRVRPLIKALFEAAGDPWASAIIAKSDDYAVAPGEHLASSR